MCANFLDHPACVRYQYYRTELLQATMYRHKNSKCCKVPQNTARTEAQLLCSCLLKTSLINFPAHFVSLMLITPFTLISFSKGDLLAFFIHASFLTSITLLLHSVTSKALVFFFEIFTA